MTEWHRAYADSPVRALPFGPVAGGGQVVVGSACILLGYDVIETTGAAVAEAQFISGGGGNGAIIADVAVPSGGSVANNLPTFGIPCNGGLFVNAAAGSVRGIVYVMLL